MELNITPHFIIKLVSIYLSIYLLTLKYSVSDNPNIVPSNRDIWTIHWYEPGANIPFGMNNTKSSQYDDSYFTYELVPVHN